MAKKRKKKKLTGHEKRQRKRLAIVSFLAAGLILTTLLYIVNAAIS